MSRALFRASPDLARLREDGYHVQQIGGYLVMREVPYVDNTRGVRSGTLISTLDLVGEMTLLDGGQRRATVTSSSRVVGLRIENEPLRKVLADHP
ncbi:MAG: hypothetical protein INR70_41460, partial [Parafilimonas terrae]|nr:hypothetical protein [Parafilimonas terrae]